MKIRNIIIKDLKIILSDKKALAIIIIMPIVLMTILSFALKGTFLTSDDMFVESVDIAVVKKYDADKDSQIFAESLKNSFIADGMGEETVKNLISSGEEVDPEEIFFEDFLESEEVSKIISYRIEDENKATELLNKEEVSAVVILPEKFIYDMKINLITPFRNNIDINILAHPDRNIDGLIVKSVMEAYSNAMSSTIIGKNVLIETALKYDVDTSKFVNMSDSMDYMSKVMENININIENVSVEGRKNINSADYYAVAMITMFILFAAGQGGRMLLEEKDNQTYQRMITAGTSRFELLSGKFITIFLIAIFQIAAMIIFSHIALKVQWGNLSLIILISLTASFSIAGLGSFVGAATLRAGNYKMANIFENAIIQVMALFGGSFFPIDVMPEFMQKLSFLSLNGMALKSYLKVMVGYGLEEIINYIALMAVLGVLFLVLAVVILKRKGVGDDAEYNKVKAVEA